MRILFLKFGALGDVLMTTPLVRQTRRAYAKAELEYCVAEPFAIGLQGNEHLNKVFTFDPSIFTGPRPLRLLDLARRLRARKYDLVFVLDKHPIFPLVASLARIPKRIGFGRDRLARLFLTRHLPYGDVRHNIHCNLDLLAQVASADLKDSQTEFSRAAADIGRLRERFPFLRDPYLACCNSGGENLREKGSIRRLPDRVFLQLLESLSAQSLTVLLGNKRDHEYYSSLVLPPNVLDLAGETTLAECAEIIAHAQKFYTTDCGLMHLAATTAVPLCAFFGPTHPRRTGLLAPEAQIIWQDEALYEPAYQTRGRIPRHQYFRSLLLAASSQS